MFTRRILGSAFLMLALLSCVAQVDPGHLGVRVDVPPDHIHTDSCGHYCHESQWYYAEGHVHGPSCGHVYRDGRWCCKHPR